jgi:hypothetical protein
LFLKMCCIEECLLLQDLQHLLGGQWSAASRNVDELYKMLCICIINYLQGSCCRELLATFMPPAVCTVSAV